MPAGLALGSTVNENGSEIAVAHLQSFPVRPKLLGLQYHYPDEQFFIELFQTYRVGY